MNNIFSLQTNENSLTLQFTKKEAKILHQPHNDALVVTLTLANAKVHQILIDEGSSVDVLSLTAFNAMNIGKEQLKLNRSPLVGFGRDKASLEGSINLPVTFEEGPCIGNKASGVFGCGLNFYLQCNPTKTHTTRIEGCSIYIPSDYEILYKRRSRSR